ncbi:MAG: 50S ribosomal protein L5 [Patescibacteria group bacterium]
MNSLKKHYNEHVVKALMEKYAYKNALAVPTIKKVVINVGLGRNLKDKEYLDVVKNTLTKITGQKPVETIAKKSISNFKIREGMVIGVKVTLRASKMWDFLEKLLFVSLPRIKDFRGLEMKGFDKNGNFSLGFKESLCFPEITADEIEKTHGLEICLSTTSKKIEEGKSLLKELGFPFRADNN